MTCTQSALILLAHGSRDPDWRAPFEQFLALFPADEAVYLAYMEMAFPTLAHVVDRLIGDGVNRMDILPLFMAVGGHLRHDVPEQIEGIQQQYPGVSIRLLPPAGQHPLVVEAIFQVCQEQRHAQLNVV